jgi:hypothetical protein
MESIVIVNLEKTSRGWTFFDPQDGQQVAGPFERERQATNHADEQGWIIED